MPKKRDDQQVNIKVGNISGVSGEVNIAGRDITMNKTITGLSGAEIAQLFNQLHSAIEANAKASPADKDDLKAEVKEIQSMLSEAAQKNEKVEEGFLAYRFRNIARMAPYYVLDIVAATLANPLAWLGIAVKKIAGKAKEEARTP